MCGITGFWSNRKLPNEQQLIADMNNSLGHRGPDGGETYTDHDANLHFGHRRLSIVELSSAGTQPMQSQCQRYHIVFNGEIYNHLALRAELDSHTDARSWRGGSDTETILAAITQWGIDKAIEKLNGMFAIALWDSEQKLLHLVRDRLGEKPLYYGFTANSLIFGSELKPFFRHPEWQGELNRDSLDQFIRWSNVPAPQTIYNNVYKLKAGSRITLKSPGDSNAVQKTYWDVLGFHAPQNFELSQTELVDVLHERLKDAVSSRLMADVPLGAFLSGGIDSSLVVALMQEVSSTKVKTFTIGFNESAYDEAGYAKVVAKHLGTDHTELYVTDQDARAVIPSLAQMWDEPFGDSSQIPTYLVSKLARNDVKVVLSGDGGDELFFGYSRFQKASRIWENIAKHPHSLRRRLSTLGGSAMAGLTNLMSASGWTNERIFNAQRLAYLYGSQSDNELYRRLVEKNIPGGVLVKGIKRPATEQHGMAAYPGKFEDRMMFQDMLNYLPNTVLTKVDRASMSVGLETRSPLLDHRLVEFAVSVPVEFKSRDGVGKIPLKQVLNRYLPNSLIDRPKQGFGVPVDSWLRGPLKEWAGDLISPSRLEREGYFHGEQITKTWNQHQKRQCSWHHQLWNVLMFQSWLDHQKDITLGRSKR